MFSLLNSWAAINPCLNRGFSFYTCYFSTVFFHSAFSWSQGYTVVLCHSCCCVQAGEPWGAFHRGSRERELHNHREGDLRCENHVIVMGVPWQPSKLAWWHVRATSPSSVICCHDNHQKLHQGSCLGYLREAITCRWRQGEWRVGQRTLHVRLLRLFLWPALPLVITT